jgi:anaerobic magnesium-protoporphyrin IX monomethyl ester cyclase
VPEVAIIYPYFRTRADSEILFPPLGAANLMAQMNSLNIQSHFIDCTFIDIQKLSNQLDAIQPQIIGIYTMITLSHNTFRIVELVQEILPGCLAVSGGPMPTLYPETYAKKFDAVFRGEADLSFPRFCKDYLDKDLSKEEILNLNLASYDGLFVQRDGIVINNPEIHYIEEIIQGFPLPERSVFDHHHYQLAGLEREGRKRTSLMTTFGCPFDCDFCSKPIFGHGFRKKNISSVMAEVENITSAGYDSLWIGDDNFTLDPKFVEEFCNSINNNEIAWSCLSRTNGIDISTIELMKDSGCDRVYLGLESGNQVTLNLMNKKTTVEENTETVHQFHKAGIDVTGFFMVGYPGETRESIEDTFNYALSLPINNCSFSVPYPLPGSKLFQRVTGLDLNRDWVIENENSFLFHSVHDTDWINKRIRAVEKEINARPIANYQN